MSGFEVAAITLGTAVAKTACGVWLGDHRMTATVGASLVDLAAQRLTSAREQRRFRRLWEQAAELVADRVEPLVEREFRGLPDNERRAAVDAVSATFDGAALTEDDLFAQDLDAGFLDRQLRGQDPGRAAVAGLSEAATALYNLLLRECCAYAIELVRTLPSAAMTGLGEVLRRERQVLDDLQEVLERLPARRGLSDFARDYRQLVANAYDRVELFGASLAESSRRYPLSVAYLSLTVSGEFTIRRPGDGLELFRDSSAPETTLAARVDDVIASTRRLFVRGQAGLGKTTLLQWIAVQSARGSFPERLTDWNNTVPFFLALRRHAGGELPAPERFVAEAGRHIAAEMPVGWVHEQLRSGRAVVLVDGVDELAEARRDEARRWLRELVIAFPAARYVVTSRPAAVPADWLGHDDLNFDVAELDPMIFADVPTFIHRWHEAMREQCGTSEERAELDGYEEQLLAALSSQRHLRALSGNPLLCALLCALHRDRRGQLPGGRMELYEVALQMLLERRDRERRIAGQLPALTRTAQTLLLRDLAYWLIRNGWTSAPAERVRERIAAKLAGMTPVDGDAGEVYRLLLERSGLLREPVAGQTDFIHRTFQEYLAGQEAAATDDIGVLLANAHTDLWSEVVVMAAGQATTSRRTELIRGLLDRAERERRPRSASALRLLAVASLETSPELPPDLRREVQKAAETLLPPRTMAAAQSLARTGGFTLDLLARTEPRGATEVAATIRAIADIGDPAALPMLDRFGRDPRKTVVRELLRAWSRFDPEQYARTVLPAYPLRNDGYLEISDRRMIPALGYLTNLRKLRVGGTKYDPVDLSFVQELPNLRELSAPDFSDLSPLAGSHLEVLRGTIVRHSLEHCDPVSLSPLSDVPNLRVFRIDRSVADVRALLCLERLEELHLTRIGTSDLLAELSPLCDITDFGCGGMPDLRDLRALSFLNRPVAVQLANCPALTDVSDLGRWSETLADIAILQCPIADLTPLATLHKLTRLTLFASGEPDLSPIASLGMLKEITLGGDLRPDLHPLSKLPALADVHLWTHPGVDLEPLSGREGITIHVGPSTTVRGAERLGAGSRVVRS